MEEGRGMEMGNKGLMVLDFGGKRYVCDYFYIQSYLMDRMGKYLDVLDLVYSLINSSDDIDIDCIDSKVLSVMSQLIDVNDIFGFIDYLERYPRSSFYCPICFCRGLFINIYRLFNGLYYCSYCGFINNYIDSLEVIIASSASSNYRNLRFFYFDKNISKYICLDDRVVIHSLRDFRKYYRVEGYTECFIFNDRIYQFTDLVDLLRDLGEDSFRYSGVVDVVGIDNLGLGRRYYYILKALELRLLGI